jgi:hypothetical protein
MHKIGSPSKATYRCEGKGGCEHRRQRRTHSSEAAEHDSPLLRSRSHESSVIAQRSHPQGSPFVPQRSPPAFAALLVLSLAPSA